jgi:hypothetical protein
MTPPRPKRVVSEEVGMLSGLESGEFGIEELEWLKRQASTDVFEHTLRQVVQQGVYECDAETVAWAVRELDQLARHPH